MKQYYLIQDNTRLGPFSIEELEKRVASPNDQIWEKGTDELKCAIDILNPSTFTEKPPPVPFDINEDGDIDYSTVEDISNVDYKIPIVLTILYIFLYVFMDTLALKPIGIALATLLAGSIWYYYNTYFSAVGDKYTSNWVKLMIVAYVIFGIVNVFAVLNQWKVQVLIAILENIVGGSTLRFENIAGQISKLELGLIIATLIIFFVGFRLIFVSRKHKFFLKRIALSSMIFIPISFLINLATSVELKQNLMDQALFSFFFWGKFVYLLPYYFLLHHFFRAELEDATP